MWAMNKTMEQGYVDMHNAHKEIPSPVFCSQETFSGFAACPWFQNSLTFGRALLIRGVYQLITFLCGPIRCCTRSRTRDHRLHAGFLFDNSANDLLQLFSRQCGRLLALLKNCP